MVASEVIRIGRKRTRQDSITASATPLPSLLRWCANSTMRMLFDMETPASMTTAISDMTFIVVPVSTKVSSTPMMPGGNAPEVHAALLKEAPRLAERMLFMTGGATTAETLAFVTAHAKNVLPKPLDLANLRKRVGEMRRLDSFT